jgi:hypothetical protein
LWYIAFAHDISTIGHASRQHPAEWYTNAALLISISSAVLSLVAAFYTRSMAQSTKKAYQLAARQDARREPELALYLVDAQSFRSGERIEVAVSVTASNPTDIDNSLVRAELGIEYHRSDRQAIVLKIAPTEESSTIPGFTPQKTLSIPLPISAHQSAAGWLIFKLPPLLSGSVIDHYFLLVEDSHQKTTTLANLFIREGMEYRKEAVS